MPIYERRIPLPCRPESGGLYGALCAALPPQYAAGRGCEAGTLRFAVEAGALAEIRVAPCGGGAMCTVRYRAPGGPAAAPEQAGAYLELFAGLIRAIGGRKSP